MEIKIEKCDLCGLEHRSDTKRRWDNSMGAAKFSVQGIASLQQERIYEHLCPTCGKHIWAAILGAIEEVKKDF